MDVALRTFAAVSSLLGDPVNLTSNVGGFLSNQLNNNVDCLSLVPEDATLSFLGLAAKYGYPGEQHEVITEDGYILTIFRIPGNRKGPPLVIFHGVFESSDTWIERGETSLAITLARLGYELWFGNTRGNQYSRGHVSADVELDSAKYWNFTFNELGKYDLAATIDYVLNYTGAKKVNGVGHSQGTTMYFVLCSTRPEYNNKINLITTLAPVAYLHNTPPPVSTAIRLAPILYVLGRALNIQEVLSEDSLIVRASKLICPLPVGGYSICALGIIFPGTGYDITEFEPCFLRVYIGHYPTPTSLKNLNHFSQVGLSKRFAQYDYGAEGNRIAYNSSTPPDYDLKKITTKVALLVGRNDHLSTIADVAILRRQLSNVVYRVVPRLLCNHLDFTVGRTMSTYLYPDIFNFLRLYGNY